MALTLDHVVVAVSDLATAVADYTDLGFTVVPGGEHAGGGTHNALVVFADGTYLELIAFREPAPGFRWWQVLGRAGEGLVDFALLPRDITETVRFAKERGLDLDGPHEGGRLRPDGEGLEWRTARSARSDLPFLCADVTPRALRVPEGDVRTHRNGVVGLAELIVAVEDVETSAQRYEALLGEAGDAAEGGRVFRLGGTTVRLASRAAGPAVARLLDTRGEGPVSVRFAGREAELLDGSRSHGARLTIGTASGGAPASNLVLA